MKTVSIHDAKTNLSKYIAEAKKGEKIYIGGFGKPEVQLSAIIDSNQSTAKKRVFTSAKGKVNETKHSFSQETEKVITDLMLQDL